MGRDGVLAGQLKIHGTSTYCSATAINVQYSSGPVGTGDGSYEYEFHPPIAHQFLSSPLLVTTTTARQVTATNYMALHGELGF